MIERLGKLMLRESAVTTLVLLVISQVSAYFEYLKVCSSSKEDLPKVENWW